MDALTLLVINDPSEPHLRLLERLPPETNIVAGETPEAFARVVTQADVILNGSHHAGTLQALWRQAPRVRWVHSLSAGVEQVLFEELARSAVPLTNSRGVYSSSLAEFALAAVLFFAKDLRRMIRSQAAGVWEQFDVAEVRGQTLGIVGYGDIGRAVAACARALGMRVIALRRRPGQSAGDTLVDLVVGPEKKLELMAASDYVVVSTPLTPDTRGIVGEAELRAMKPEAVVINVGRGPAIDEPALVRALEQRRIRGAALDVFEVEPLPPGHPFYRLDNVLLSPHCADHTIGWKDQSMLLFLDNFERFRTGEPLLNLVDKSVGY